VAIHQSPAENDARLRRRADWRHRLPVLTGAQVTLRSLREGDARSLLAHLSTAPVQRYIAPCPASIEGLRRFVRWTRAERRRGLHVCYGVVPRGHAKPVGIIQLWAVERDFSTAEWGFALSDRYWGTGLFASAAGLLLDFAFDTLAVQRLEARAVDADGRGNGSLRKLGATREGVLRQGFRSGDKVRDYIMWSLLADEWRRIRGAEKTD
jgi:ribosomal-protein-alanine N-acetyltransferase